MTTTINKTATTAIDYGPTSVEIFSAGDEPCRIRVFADHLVFIAVGPNAEASEVNCVPVAEFTEAYFEIAAHETASAAGVSGETTGILWVTEV